MSHHEEAKHDQNAPGQPSTDDYTNDLLGQSLLSDSPLKVPVELKPNQFGIAVRIVENFNKEENFNRYTVYVIKGFDTNGAIEIARRYSDFVKIRETLLARWPGCYIPPIPSKNLLNNMDAHFVRERRIGLDLFLQKTAEIPYLYNSKEFQSFLRYSGSDFAKEIKAYQKVFYDEMVARYAETFQHLAQIQSADEANILITRFKAFLNKMTGKFKTFKSVAKEAVRAKRAYFIGMSTFQTMVAAEYEKEVIGEYQNNELQNPVFVKTDNQTGLETHVQRMKDAAKNQSIEYFYNWLNAESLEIEALIDAIKQKEKFEGLRTKAEEKVRSLNAAIEKISSGQFYWKTILSTKTKENEIADIQKEIEETRKDIENLTLLGDMIVLIIAYDELGKFRANKAENFYNLVNTAAQAELDNLISVNDYWTTVQKNNSGRNSGAPILANFA